MGDDNDVVVIGAGIVGVCCAIFIARSGRRVTLIDRLAPGDEGAASFGNAGSISWSSCIPIATPGLLTKVPGWLFRRDGPLTIRWRHLHTLAPWLWRLVRAGSEPSVIKAAAALSLLHTPSLELHRELATSAGVPDLIRDCDFLHVYAKSEPDRLAQLEWRLRLEHGARLELLNQDELSDKVPHIARRFPQTVNIRDQGYIADPSQLVSAYAQYLGQLGGKVVQAEVEGFERTDAQVTAVRTATAVVPGADFVIAAGPWSRALTRSLGFDVPLDAERGYHLSVADSGVSLEHTVMETDAKFVATPMDCGLRFAGTVELASVDAPPDYSRADGMLSAARRLFPQMHTGDITRWMGRRPSLPDGLPMIGPVPGHDNVVVAFGHAHTGMVGAPNTGRMIADLVSHKPINVDLAPFSPTRFK